MIRRCTETALLAVLGLLVVCPCGTSAPREDLERWWADLGSTDGVRAYRALGQLETASEASVPFLDKHLRPVVGAAPRKIAQMIAGLDSEQFAVREQAERDLEKLQDLAEGELSKALAGKPALEVRLRIERLLDKLDPLKNPERLQALRAIEVLEHIGTPGAKQVLQRLADGAPEAKQTREAKASLERLAKRAKPR